MRLESNVNLLVAALDLKLVRLVRAAMNADGTPHGPGGSVHPAPAAQPRRRIRPEPDIEPRLRFHPEPRFEPRPVHLQSGLDASAGLDCCPAATPVEPVAGKSSSSPIEPPWKVLPWEQEPAPRPRPLQKVKVVTGRPDMFNKGNVIDLFI